MPVENGRGWFSVILFGENFVYSSMNKLMEEIWKLDAEEQLLIAKAILERADGSGMPHSIEFEEEQIWYQNLLARQEKTPENVVLWEEMKSRIRSRL